MRKHTLRTTSSLVQYPLLVLGICESISGISFDIIPSQVNFDAIQTGEKSFFEASHLIITIFTDDLLLVCGMTLRGAAHYEHRRKDKKNKIRVIRESVVTGFTEAIFFLYDTNDVQRCTGNILQ